VRIGGTETAIVPNFKPPISEFREVQVSRPRDPVRSMGAIAMPRPNATYGVHNNSLNNLRRGLLERVLPLTPVAHSLCSPPSTLVNGYQRSHAELNLSRSLH